MARTFPSIGIILPLALALPGCSMQRFADNFPFVHRIDVQQGNEIEPANVDQLRPGMAKRQARFVMGTPLLIDLFHNERWDYVYSLKLGRSEATEYRMSLFFEDDQLVRVAGDFRPNPRPKEELTPREKLVVVPVLPKKKKGILDRLFGGFGLPQEEELE
jgi:outer membrane protein assembly factor BamE